jgi:hypothetical protein
LVGVTSGTPTSSQTQKMNDEAHETIYNNDQTPTLVRPFTGEKMLTFIKISTGGDNQDHVSRPGTATKSIKVSESIKNFESQRGSFSVINHPITT